MILLYIIAGFILIILIWHFATIKFTNPNLLHMIVGKKGCGKTTIASMLAYKFFKKGLNVYSSEDIRVTIKGIEYKTIVIDPKVIYKYYFVPESKVIIDEAATIWHSRNFAKMDPRTIQWFKYQRHMKLEVFLFSQSFDIDRAIRVLVDKFYLCHKFGRIITFVQQLHMQPVIVHPEGDAPASIQDDFIEEPFLFTLFSGIQFVWIPKWTKLFDSFKLPDQMNQDPKSILPLP